MFKNELYNKYYLRYLMLVGLLIYFRIKGLGKGCVLTLDLSGTGVNTLVVFLRGKAYFD